MNLENKIPELFDHINTGQDTLENQFPKVKTDIQILSDAAEGYASDLDIDVDAAFIKFQSTISKTTKSPNNKTNIFKWIALAASITLLIGFFFKDSFFPKDEQVLVLNTTENVQKYTLKDNSVIWLKPNSKITYTKKFAKENRIIELVGDGYFEITKSKIPFQVKTTFGKVSVLGTKFYIQQSEVNKRNVFVKEGRVVVSSKAEERILTKNQGLRIDSKSGAMLSITNLPNTFNWANPELSFNNTELLAITQLLESYFDVEISIDKNIQKCKFTSLFPNPNLNQILDLLAVSYGAKWEQTSKSSYKILGGSCD